MKKEMKFMVRSEVGEMFYGKAEMGIGPGRCSFEVSDVRHDCGLSASIEGVNKEYMMSGLKFLMNESCAVSVKLEDNSEVFRVKNGSIMSDDCGLSASIEGVNKEYMSWPVLF